MTRENRRRRYAVVGQGWFAQEAALTPFTSKARPSPDQSIFRGPADKPELIAAPPGG